MKAGNFEALESTDPIFTVLRDLNPLKEYTKNQEASYNFRLGFALSKGPHLQRAYVVTVRKLNLHNVSCWLVYFFIGHTLIFTDHNISRFWKEICPLI